MNEELEIKIPERTIETITTEIKALQSHTLACAIEIGRRLAEAKGLLDHGKWGSWLANEVDFSHRQANNLMQLFKEYGSPQSALFGAELNSQTYANISVSKALRLIAIPEEEREDFARDKDVEHISTRELEELIKERDRLKNELAAAQEGSAIAIGEREDELNAEIDGLTKKLDLLKEEAEDSADRAAELEEKIKDLEGRPIDVAVQRDEEAIAQAVSAAKAEKEKELEALRKKLEAAEKKRDRAEAEVEEAKSSREELEQQLQEEREQLLKDNEQLKAKALEEQEKARVAAAKASPVMAQFEILFSEVQGTMNRLLLLAKNAGENEDKLRAAIKALCEKLASQTEG